MTKLTLLNNEEHICRCVFGVQMYVHAFIHFYMYVCLFLFAYGGILACVCAFTVGVKKVPIYRPYNGTGNSVPFPFV